MKWKLIVSANWILERVSASIHALHPDRSGEAPVPCAIWSTTPPRQMRCATNPVQPVWCEAPIPAPVSPWKYSWNWSRSFHSGSVWNFSIGTVDRSPAVGVGEPGRDQPAREVGRDVTQPKLLPGSGREFDGVVLAEPVSQLRSAWSVR